MSIRLSEDEAWAVIAAAHTGILTTLRADGSPVTLPMWFVADDRTVVFTTFEGTKKLARIRRDPPRLVPGRVGRALGRAVLRSISAARSRRSRTRPRWTDSTRSWMRSTRRSAPRGAAMPAKTAQHYTGKRVLRLVPAGRILTWDNSRLDVKDDA